jgi:hypothetical protein
VPFAILFFFLASNADASRVRTVEVDADQIVTIKTAIGVATIIQVPDRPTSLVAGDSEAFKIEYLDQAITVKPLRSNAKSNLYIYTDWKRFNVQLVTSQESAADYIVYLKSRSKKVPTSDVISWRSVDLNSHGDDLNLRIKRIGSLKSEYVFIEFQLSGKHGDVDPKWFWLTQKGKSRPVHRLALSSLSLNQDGHLDGLLQIRLKDISKSDGVAIEIRRKKTSTLNIPKEILWK